MKIMGRQEVVEATGIHPHQISRWVKAGSFPKPITKLAATPVWRESDVKKWLSKNK